MRRAHSAWEMPGLLRGRRGVGCSGSDVVRSACSIMSAKKRAANAAALLRVNVLFAPSAAGGAIGVLATPRPAWVRVGSDLVLLMAAGSMASPSCQYWVNAVDARPRAIDRRFEASGAEDCQREASPVRRMCQGGWCGVPGRRMCVVGAAGWAAPSRAPRHDRLAPACGRPGLETPPLLTAAARRHRPGARSGWEESRRP
jgi:hypothetical protein